MQITEIKKIGKGDRYSIFIDYIFSGTLEAEILVKYKLKTGDEIDEENLKNIKLENGKLATFSRALNYIEKGLHTEKQIVKYLKEKGYEQESIENAVTKLKEYGYINDEYYTESYIRSYKDKKGKIKLKYDLISKGVNPQIIDQKIQELINNKDSLFACKKLLEKYIKNKTFDRKLKAKAFSYLISKGFESDIIINLLNEVALNESGNWSRKNIKNESKATW